MCARAGQWVARYRYHVAAGAVAAGLGLSTASAEAVAGTALVTGIVLVAAQQARSAVVCALLVIAGGGVGELRLRAIDRPGDRLAAWSQVDGRAVLLERPRPAGARTHAVVRLTGGARVLAVAEQRGLWPRAVERGVELSVRGLLKPPFASDRGSFDWPAHLRRRGIAYELHLGEAKVTGHRRGGIAGAVDSARRRAERAIDRGLPADKAALMRGMVLGQDEEIDPLVKDDWRDSGLAHLLAVSGQNVMLLCALALPFLALAGAAPRARIAVLLLLIGLYVPLAGAGPSLQRAGVMGAAGLLALASSRPASASYGLLLAAIGTLAVNPRISGDPGWQLSFAAVVGILAARPFAPRSAIGGALWLTGAATLFTTPLLATHFGAVPLVSIPANLAALPAVAPVMWMGMLDAALGQLPGTGVVSRVIALLAGPLLAYLTKVAEWFASLQGAVVDLRLGPEATVGSYVVLALFVLAAVRLAPRYRTQIQVAREQLRTVPLRVRAALAICLASAAALVLAPLGAPAPPSHLTISFLDVGQGDSVLIQHPDGTSVLFDGGRPEARVVRLVRQAGIRRLSLLVATHQSADHHGGLVELVRRLPVETLLENGDGTRDPTFLSMVGDARARGARVLTARAGQLLRVGALTIRILWPRRRPPGVPLGDPNERAVIALVSCGQFDLLLSADAESPALAQVDLPDVEAIKVPHHGSADPGLPRQLARLRPEVAVIEVGKGNSYGHPAPSTLAALERVVPNVRRTDRDGTVRLQVADGRLLLD